MSMFIDLDECLALANAVGKLADAERELAVAADEFRLHELDERRDLCYVNLSDATEHYAAAFLEVQTLTAAVRPYDG